MSVTKISAAIAVAASLAVASFGVAPAAAGQVAPFGAPQRPTPAVSGPTGLAATLAAIVEAELAAKELKAQATANPFLKPRPRPNREHVATARVPGG